MLPLVIIEQIKQREEEQRRRERERVIQLPLPMPDRRWPRSEDEDGDRGAVIIEVG